MASPPARSTGWWRPWGWPGCPRTPSRGCAVGWTSRSKRSGSGRWRSPTRICGWTPRWRRSGPAAGSSTAPWWWPTGSTSPANARSSGLDVGAAETEAFWREFLRSLVRRGLAGVQLVVSDAHEGLKTAIAQVLGAPWQRCTVHFLRDALGHCPKDLQQLVGAAIRPIFRAANLEDARRLLGETVTHLEGRVPKVARLLLEAEPDLLAFYGFPAAHRSKLRSTDESFKGPVALPAGSGVVRLSVGRGRPRSEEQGRGAGSPAAQLCPLRASTSRPSGGGHAPLRRLLLGWRLRLPAGHQLTVGDLGLLGERPLAPLHRFQRIRGRLAPLAPPGRQPRAQLQRPQLLVGE